MLNFYDRNLVGRIASGNQTIRWKFNSTSVFFFIIFHIIQEALKMFLRATAKCIT